MRSFFLLMFAIILLAGCSGKKDSIKELIKIDNAWLDSIKRKSDTSWIKPYRNNEFVTSEYYINRKDSIVTQLMKDSAGTIRQVSIAKYDLVRLFFAAYFANGQIEAEIPLDYLGKKNGPEKFYYPDGQIKSEGIFLNGFYSGEWRNYDEKGKLVSTDEYDSNGQLIKSAGKN